MLCFIYLNYIFNYLCFSKSFVVMLSSIDVTFYDVFCDVHIIQMGCSTVIFEYSRNTLWCILCCYSSIHMMFDVFFIKLFLYVVLYYKLFNSCDVLFIFPSTLWLIYLFFVFSYSLFYLLLMFSIYIFFIIYIVYVRCFIVHFKLFE
jgi:hypothetical protein